MDMVEFLKQVSGGRIFSVRFVKRTTGDERHMVCRLGCKDTGVGLSYDPAAKGLLPVYDMQTDAPTGKVSEHFRQISLDGLLEARVAGRCWTWDNAACRFLEKV